MCEFIHLLFLKILIYSEMEKNMDGYREALLQFGTAIGLPDLAPDEKGYCCLQFDDKNILHFQYQPEEENLVIFTQLGFVDVDHTTAVYEMLLEGNFFNRNNDQAVLSVQPGNGAIFLTRTIVNERLPEAFERVVENFMNSTDLWVAKIEAANTAEDEEEGSERAKEEEETQELLERTGLEA